MGLKMLARKVMERGKDVTTSPPEAGYRADPAILSERIGMKYEREIPDTRGVRADHPEDGEKVLGKPVLIYRGEVLAWENDTPETKVFAWSLVNLFPGRPLTVDVEPVARLLELSPREVRDALARLVKDGDLVRSWEGGREWYRLNIHYSEGK